MIPSPKRSFWATATQWFVALSVALALPAYGKVLDNFDASARSGWTDSNPANLPLPGGTQANGVFSFGIPAIGQAYFVASTKTTEAYELKSGRTLELRVDMVNGKGTDSYAVLAWIPTATGANTLAGYGLAKSETDVLITKGIGKYFYNEVPAPAIKNENVTLVLTLTAKNNNVYITGKILDKDNNNSVLWEKSFVDTPAADILADGTDSPAAPFVTTGNFVLYLYADGGQDPTGYSVTYDNAETYVMDTTVVDDFNAPARSGWTDSNPANLPLPSGTQAGGVFTFGIPAIGQAYFVASTKTSSAFKLEEGVRHEFSVDMIGGQGGDSFAVLAWIPTATGANTLAGYGIAKSETDMLLTKGIGKYFFNENMSPAVKNNNITLSLELTVKSGNVIIHGRVLDKDADNAVIFDKTFVDTSAADILADGTDSPAAPFLTTGNIVLYLYADGGQDPNGYGVVYDNLVASAPPVGANVAPIISDSTPIKGANFLAAPAQLTFKATDDKALPDSGISVNINGTNYTTANGLTLSGSTSARTATFAGLAANQVYTATLRVQDSDGAVTTNLIWFDTLTSTIPIVEAEDYNFESGGSFNNPVRTAEGWGAADNSFTDRAGVEGVDFHDSRTSPNGADTLYRTVDPVRMQHTLDLQRSAFDNGAYVYDYDIGDFAAGDWNNYTRTFAAGSYEVYLREAVVNFPLSESVLEQVTSDRTQPNQTTKVLGSFIASSGGYTFRLIPLTDGTGLNKVVLRLSGATTLRLRQVTADGGGSVRFMNYLVFVPVTGASVQRATVSSVSPANNDTFESASPVIAASILNRDTTVNRSSVSLTVNGATVPATVSATADGASVSYNLSPLPPSGSVVSCQVNFKDNEGADVSAAWSFTLTYKALDPANSRPGPGINPGFRVRLVQAPMGSALANDIARAEDQLALNPSIPVYVDTNFVSQVINQAQDDRSSGFFQAPDYPETILPGLDEFNGTDDFTVECRAWLQLAPGVYRFGVVTDDGYKISSGASLASKDPILAFHNGGPANETVDFVVTSAGLYPFRFVWYERGGNALGELFSVNTVTGDRTLINDPVAPGAIKAFQDATAGPTLQLESSATVTGGYAVDSAASINAGAKTITVNASGAARFFRLKGTAAKIKAITVNGGVVTLSYE